MEEIDLITVIIRDFGGIGALILLLWRVVWPVMRDHLSHQRLVLDHMTALVEQMDKRLVALESRCEARWGIASIAPIDSNGV